MKTVIRTAAFAALLAAGIAGAEEPAKPAAQPAAAQTEAAKPAASTDASGEKVALESKATKRKACDPPSGTRIKPPANGPCKAVVEPYRVWTAKQIAETGEINTGDALAKLDPIITVQ